MTLAGQASAGRLFRHTHSGLKPALRRQGSLAASLTLLATSAPAQDSAAFTPCIAAHDTQGSYVAAFEAEGWALTTGEAREAALLGPGEMFFRTRYFPHPETTLAELEDRLAAVREWNREWFVDWTVLTRGEAALVLRLDAEGPQPQVTCLVTAADLPETDTFLPQEAEPGVMGGIAMASFMPPEPPGLSHLRIDAVRLVREVKPSEPLPGTEGIFVSFTLEPVQ